MPSFRQCCISCGGSRARLKLRHMSNTSIKCVGGWFHCHLPNQSRVKLNSPPNQSRVKLNSPHWKTNKIKWILLEGHAFSFRYSGQEGYHVFSHSIRLSLIPSSCVFSSCEIFHIICVLNLKGLRPVYGALLQQCTKVRAQEVRIPRP